MINLPPKPVPAEAASVPPPAAERASTAVGPVDSQAAELPWRAEASERAHECSVRAAQRARGSEACRSAERPAPPARDARAFAQALGAECRSRSRCRKAAGEEGNRQDRVRRCGETAGHRASSSLVLSPRRLPAQASRSNPLPLVLSKNH